jgi:lipoprotein-anchoring transpeptidase ErfK/SrfK
VTVSLRQRMFPTRVAAAATAAAAAVTLAACSGISVGKAGSGSSGSGTSTSSSSSSAPVPKPTPAEIVVSPADRAVNVRPDAPLTVSAKVGTITSVKVTDATGSALKGALGSDGTWKASARMKPASAYVVTVVAAAPDGSTAHERTTFTTLKPTTIATYGINYSGMTVGVGMPVAIQFDSQVTSKAYRAAVEKAVTVTTVPKQEGSWGWLDNRQLMWRPKNYWVAGTKVTVSAPLTGVQTGDSKWVGNDASGGFTVGAATVSTVNIATHQMTVTQNGRLLRTVPVSTGRNQMPYITRSGTKVIIEKQPTVIMDSATSGIPKGNPDYYREKVDWDLRLTWTGEYIHSAPWSVGSQGVANVSHGCVNVSPSNAIWMYNLSKVGDVVKFVGSSRPFLPTEGIGVWQYSYANWQQQSALT